MPTHDSYARSRGYQNSNFSSSVQLAIKHDTGAYFRFAGMQFSVGGTAHIATLRMYVPGAGIGSGMNLR